MRMQMASNIFVRFLRWALFAGFVGYGFGWMASGPEYILANRLHTTSVSAPAKITSVNPGDSMNPPSAYFHYQFGGQAYDGYSHIKTDDAHKLAPGQTVQIRVDPIAPKDSGLDPDAMTDSAKDGFLIAGVIELVIGLIFWALLLVKLFRGGGFAGSTISVGVALVVMMTGGLGALFLNEIPSLLQSMQLVSGRRTAQANIAGVYDHKKDR